MGAIHGGLDSWRFWSCGRPGGPRPPHFHGKTRRKSAVSTPERGHTRNPPPIGRSGGIFTPRPHGGSRAQNRPGSHGNGPKPEERLPGPPAGTPMRASVEPFARRPHGGCRVRMHFPRGSGLLGLGCSGFYRADRILMPGKPAGVPEGPQGGHERHTPPQPETGRRKHSKNSGSPEFPPRIPRYLRGRRKPGRKGHGKSRYFGTTGCCIHVRIRGFPISGCQIVPKSM